ncbi:MAG TPA: DNA-processing protein DprA [Bryobacteraceae bacterium]|nr:DNA-processing protein DprA [Bryobacteraceae bacterium]
MTVPATAELTRETELHWLALRMTPGLGTRTAVQLIGTFKTPQAVFRASRSELEAAGVSAGLAQSIASGCAFDDAVTQQQKLAEAEAIVIPLTDPRYPARLKEIFDPPPLLFTRGRVELMGELMLGIVGTRRPTAYGIAAASRLAKDLTCAGLAIASGMARGIDTAAHRAALEVGLEAGGGTVAVFGCGVDEVYPSENRKLAEHIAREGLIVSEFPMATPPYPQNFPIRNRIIAGMSVGVLVVEGGEYSGSAITAKLAAEQNREVFAVPGNITSKMSWGPNLLIKQGAKLVQEWNDVVVDLQAEDRRRLVERCRNRLNLKDNTGAETKDPLQSSLEFRPEGASRAVLNHLKPDASITLDYLVESLAGTSPSEIIAALFELELAGLIRQLPGKSFIKVWAD